MEDVDRGRRIASNHIWGERSKERVVGRVEVKGGGDEDTLDAGRGERSEGGCGVGNERVHQELVGWWERVDGRSNVRMLHPRGDSGVVGIRETGGWIADELDEVGDGGEMGRDVLDGGLPEEMGGGDGRLWIVPNSLGDVREGGQDSGGGSDS